MFDFIKKRNTQRVYLDYASTTPVLPEVFESMQPYFSKKFFNPSSLYLDAVEVKKNIESARTEVARLVSVKKDEVYFTGSGTESDNLALLGIFEYFKNTNFRKDERSENENSANSNDGVSKDKIINVKKSNLDFVPHIITSTIEHPAVLETCKEIERRGGEVTYVGVNENGLVNVEEIKKSIKENTVLVSVMYASNEIGTIEPIAQIGRAIFKWKQENNREQNDFPYFHTDASQAPLYLNIETSRAHVDMMTLDGSKIYGPKGVGVLIKKNYVPLSPIMFGGGQEGGLRPSTENPAMIVGFKTALSFAIKNRDKEVERISKLRDYMIDEILKTFPSAILNGDRENRLPNNVNICFPGTNAEFMVIQLSEKGIDCSFMTACKNLDDDSSSYVIKELKNGDCANSSLRFTLGKYTTKPEIDFTLVTLREILKK